MLKRKASDRQASQIVIPKDWEGWLRSLFPLYIDQEFSMRHKEFWEWVWTVRRGIRPLPFVAVWPRGGGKSTSSELACVRLGAQRVRDYIWYCCGVQEQAEKHLDTVAEILEGDILSLYYPKMSNKHIGRYGRSAWSRKRIWTDSGFVVDAIGLDTAARGAKVKHTRPDFIILDDLDDKGDTPKITDRKMTALTDSILPSGSPDCGVLFVQNLITPHSIASQLCKEQSPFLTDRILSGPYPAIDRLVTEQGEDGVYRIISGIPTWTGQDLEVCQDQINTWGLTSFRKEAQHEVNIATGGMFNHLTYRHISRSSLPDLVSVTVWIDPAVSATDESDCHAIQADGLGKDGVIYRLFSWEQRATPLESLQRGILKAIELGSNHIGVETDQGGDTWQSVYREAIKNIKAETSSCLACGTPLEIFPKGLREKFGKDWKTYLQKARKTQDYRDIPMMCPICNLPSEDIVWIPPRFTAAKAGSIGPKTHRASQMLADYEGGGIIHVIGTHDVLENALNRFPRQKPFDLVDAAFWSWHYLKQQSRRWVRGSGG